MQTSLLPNPRLTTTDAIVLSLQPHSDKAHILHAYTRVGGRVNYMVYGLGKKNAIVKYVPLSIVQITTDDKSVRTANLTYVPANTITDPYKRAIALFIGEVLFHTLRHPMPDEPMYDFLVQTIQELDAATRPENIHLQFLVDFAAKLGFAMEREITLPRSREARQELLRQLCAYFAEHVETWKSPRSLDVLTEVFA